MSLNWRILSIVLIILILPLISQGGVIDDLNEQIKEQEVKRAELERQAQEYQQIINQKQGEIKSLKNQIAIFNARINKLQIEINITEDDIYQTKLEILQLEYGIEGTEDDIFSQKENLAKIIQTIAEFDQTSQMEMILQSEVFSDFFSQITYLDNLQTGVQERVNKLKALKERLNQDKESQEEKQERLEGLKKQITQQKWSLASQRNSEEALLKYTRGEESEYQQMLANIEAS